MTKQTHSSFLAVLGGLSFFALTTGMVGTVSANPSENLANQEFNAEQVDVSSIHGTVAEIIAAAGYTYVAIDVDGKKVWAAGPEATFKVGDKIGFSMKMPIANFQSRSLERTFDKIYFVDGFITEGGALSDKSSKMSLSHASSGGMPNAPHAKTQATEATGKVSVNIKKIEGGKDIAEIYAEKEALSGKPIRVRGEVTKFTPNILGVNWIHIRDNSTKTDLTVTSSDTVAVGDIVALKGIIALEKDYGYGYVYPVILEKAEVIKE